MYRDTVVSHGEEVPDITCIDSESFTLKPVVAELLRTNFCVDGSIFLVEGVDSVYTSKSKRWRAVRLILGDGDLCIQALLAPELHPYIDRREVTYGSYIKLEKFRIQRKQSAHEQMVCLVVEDLRLVGWDNTLIGEINEDPDVETDTSPGMEEASPGDQVHQHDAEPQPPAANQVPLPRKIKTHVIDDLGDRNALLAMADEAKDDDDDDGFEVMAVSQQKVTQNRIAADQTSSNINTRSTKAATARPWLTTNPSKPAKLTNLKAIPYLPYKQNWSVNVLAVVSNLSDLEPSGLPPYRQRQARLADPSTSKHVLLTVFVDPEHFVPKIGSVVLLLGVKNHLFDGGSLKKYASDKPAEGKSWWFEDPLDLTWCDVAGLQEWWRGMMMMQQQDEEEEEGFDASSFSNTAGAK